MKTYIPAGLFDPSAPALDFPAPAPNSEIVSSEPFALEFTAGERIAGRQTSFFDTPAIVPQTQVDKPCQGGCGRVRSVVTFQDGLRDWLCYDCGRTGRGSPAFRPQNGVTIPPCGRHFKLHYIGEDGKSVIVSSFGSDEIAEAMDNWRATAPRELAEIAARARLIEVVESELAWDGELGAVEIATDGDGEPYREPDTPEVIDVWEVYEY